VRAQAENDLQSLLGERHPSAVRLGVALSEISRWRIGGVATAVAEPKSIVEASEILGLLSHRPEPLLVVGEMSNILFDSAGFDGVLLRIGDSLSAVRREGTLVRAEAGVSVPGLARLTADMGLSGLEHTVGIPGTLGGLVAMNGGSQRKGIGLNVEQVKCLDRDGNAFELTHAECEFAYRSSSLQHLDAVIVEVDLRLTPRDPDAIHAEMDGVVESRKSRFPEELPNCGSTFLSDPAMYESIGAPGRAIESAGLKGYMRGGAQVSVQHANFVINTGGATSDDVLAVIGHVRDEVFRATGFAMDCEVRYVSPDGNIAPAHVAAGRRQQAA
jgi:UDP-N-acetylmuramate dehydrogenase